jgi:FtsP/CotA-like multicopper oxidase with cupredoxin domain
MSTTRRDFIKTAAAGAAIGGLSAGAAPAAGGRPRRRAELITPNGASLPSKIVNGVRVLHLVAEPVKHEFAPGLVCECWGYNGRVHGPTIEAVEGEVVRIYVTNRLPVPTTVHWHGVHLPSGMDGVGGLSQRMIEPKETFKYEFKLKHAGTFMYHSHHDEMVQMAMGLMGMFVVHPKDPEPIDRDFVYLLSEWSIEPGMRRPDPLEMMDFNILTFNARVFPGTAPLVVKTGDRVRIRIGNLSAMDHHPIHLHGHSFDVVATDGGRIPEAGRWPETTILVPTGSTRTVEFVAHTPGDWAFHCHMTHHTMNQMAHGVPNLIGLDPSVIDEKVAKLVPGYLDDGSGHGGSDEDEEIIPKNSIPMFAGPGPFGYITMGGMFTVLKVRDEAPGTKDAGWYENPKGTVADAATEEELAADGITP